MGLPNFFRYSWYPGAGAGASGTENSYLPAGLLPRTVSPVDRQRRLRTRQRRAALGLEFWKKWTFWLLFLTLLAFFVTLIIFVMISSYGRSSVVEIDGEDGKFMSRRSEGDDCKNSEWSKNTEGTAQCGPNSDSSPKLRSEFQIMEMKMDTTTEEIDDSVIGNPVLIMNDWTFDEAGDSDSGYKSSGHGEEISHAALDPDPVPTACPTGYYQCSTTPNCLPTAPTRLCDGKIDCWNADNNYTSFYCGGGIGSQNNCIAQNLICDGHKDCPNGKDEEECISLSKNLESVIIVGSQNEMSAEPEGYVLVRIKGVWHPYCSNDWSSELGDRLCGFIGASSTSSKLQLFDLYEFNARKNEIKMIENVNHKIQLIQLVTAEDLNNLHSVYSNVIELENEDFCKIGYLTCM